jgi:thioredoxin reductase (NADPH)
VADTDTEAVAFPKLTAEQIETLGRCPHTADRHFHDGEKLFDCGQKDWKFYVIKSGKVEIVDESGDKPRSVRIHGAGEFTGDISELTGTPALVSAVARGGVEAYEVTQESLKPLLNDHPDLGDLIMRAFIARRHLLRDSGAFTGPRVIGSRYSKDAFRVRDFLSKNRVPYTWLDLESDPGVDKLLRQFGVSPKDTPVVTWGQRVILRNPSNRELADKLGIRQPLENAVYDLVVVGGGPAGLAAAVYAASEGLNTVILERSGPGGQAGRSMRIENYFGFPTGITGADLAERAVLQANKFGAKLTVPAKVTKLSFDQVYQVLHVEGGEEVTARCVLIATGAEWRRLCVEGCEVLEGRGVYYAATPTEALMCTGCNVVVVGGGNSAGQAAVYLADHVKKVYLVIRHDDLAEDMSSYLFHRIEQTPKIEVLQNTEVARMIGDDRLKAVELKNTKTGETRKVETTAVFSFIGAVPRTDWLPPEIERDAHGFVRTGPSLAKSRHWTARRSPYLLETSRAGVFAAGDVRSGSVKRVTSAVGEGAMAVQFMHEYLKDM